MSLRTLLVPILLSLAMTAVHAQSGGFRASCDINTLRVGGGVVYVDKCQDGSGNQPEGSISLDSCLGNIGGQMMYLPNGGVTGSCQTFRVKEYTTISAVCGNGAGGYDTSEFDLNTIIGNQGGNLVC